MWYEYLLIALFILLSALFSGLTLGLMSLDIAALRRKVKLGNKDAKKIYPLRKKGNLLLCTLLLGNVAVNAALSLFLGSLTTGILAGFIATGLILVFGEIIPQAVFAKYALPLGAKMSWLVLAISYLLFPVTFPLAFLLDKTLGGDLPTIYSRKELRMIVEDHGNIKQHEAAIVRGGLTISEKTVKQEMTPKKRVFFVYEKDRITPTLLKDIASKGHSRIPVYSKEKKKVVGLLYSKDLLVSSSRVNPLIHKLMRKEVYYVNEIDRLDVVLRRFKRRKVHLFIVRNHLRQFSGIITLEDVLEEIVGEITDEHD